MVKMNIITRQRVCAIAVHSVNQGKSHIILVDMELKMKTMVVLPVHLASILKEATKYAGDTKIARDFSEPQF